jgi:hypothetical protein
MVFLRGRWRLFCPHCDHNAILLARRVGISSLALSSSLRNGANDDCISRADRILCSLRGPSSKVTRSEASRPCAPTCCTFSPRPTRSGRPTSCACCRTRRRRSGPIATLLIHKRPVSKSPPRPIGVGTGKTAIRAGSFSPARPFRHHPQCRRHGQRTAGREGGWPWPTSESSSTGKPRTKSRQPHWFR